MRSTRSYQIIVFIVILLVIFGAFYLPVNAQQSFDWKLPINFSNQPDTFSWSPVLACDIYNNTYAFWDEQESDRQLIFTSANQNGSWTTPVDVLITNGVRQLNGAIGLNYAFLAWTNGVRGTLYFAKGPLTSVNNAKMWSPPQVITTQIDSVSIAVDKKNVVHMVYSIADTDGLAHEFIYTNSTDNGDSWSQPISVWQFTTANPSTGDLMMKVDENNGLHIAYTIASYTYGKYRTVGYMRSTDGAKTWSKPWDIAVSQTPPGVASAGVYVFPGNEVHLTYDLPERMYRYSKDGGVTWSDPKLIVELGAAFGGYNQLAKDSYGNLHVISAVSDGVYHAIWEGDQWSKADIIDNRYIDPHNQQLAICSGNRMDILYDDRTGENEVWYVTKNLNMFGYASSPVPELNPTLQPGTSIPEPTATSSPTPGLISSSVNIVRSSNPLSPILLSLIPTIILIAIAIGIIRLRSRN